MKEQKSQNSAPILRTFFIEENWGDKISPEIFKLISGRRPRMIDVRGRLPESGHAYLTIGSILKYADSQTIVWGSGFIKADDTVKENPAEICAVRGPLSRKRLLKLGISCPQVYGDPALLLKKLYKPKVKKQFHLGIVPHYVDQDNPWLRKIGKNPKIKIINIRGDVYKVIDDIASCKNIASSSLHGLIIADAYGIPSSWLKFSDKIYGKNFKFFDYFMGVGRKEKKPLVVSPTTTVAQIVKTQSTGKINVDLEKLFQVCPFQKD